MKNIKSEQIVRHFVLEIVEILNEKDKDLDLKKDEIPTVNQSILVNLNSKNN